MEPLAPQLTVRASRSDQDATAIALQRWEVRGKISWPVLRYQIRQVFRNVGEEPLEVIYTFPLASEQLLEQFVVTLQDERVVSRLVSREAAQEMYEKAVEDGDFAVKLDRQRSNVFTLNLGNLAPGEEVVVEMQLLQLLEMHHHRVTVRIPTVVGPRYIPGKPQGINEGLGWSPPTDQVPDADWITPPFQFDATPYTVSALFEVSGDLVIRGVESPSHPFRFHIEKDGHYWVYMGDQLRANKDIVLYLESEPFAQPRVWPLTYQKQQLVALQLPGMAEETVNDLPRDVLFLIDISGSMFGQKLQTTIQAVQLCLRKLKESDRFRLIAFESETHVWQHRWARVTDAHLTKADQWLEELESLGGTELLPALLLALKATREGESDREPVIVLLTDGQVGNEAEILSTIRRSGFKGKMLLFGIDTVVNQELFQSIAQEVPAIVQYIFPGEDIRRAVNATFQELGNSWLAAIELQNDEETIPLTPSSESFPRPFSRGRQQILFMEAPKWVERVETIVLKFTNNQAKVLPVEWGACEDEAFQRALLKFWGKRILDSGVRLSPEESQQLALDLQLASPYTSWIAVYERAEKLDTLPRIQVVPVDFPDLWEPHSFGVVFNNTLHFNMVNDADTYFLREKAMHAPPDNVLAFSLVDVFARQKVRGAIEWEAGQELWDSLIAAAWILNRIEEDGTEIQGFEDNLRKLLTYLTLAVSRFTPEQQVFWEFLLQRFKRLILVYLPDQPIPDGQSRLATQFQAILRRKVEHVSDLLRMRRECQALVSRVRHE